MKNGGLLLAAAGIAAYFLWQKSQAIGSLNFIPRGVGIGGGGIILQLGIQNPSSTPLSLNSFVGNLLVNGGASGNVTSFQPVTIAPNSETVVPVYISPNVFGVFNTAMNMINSGSTSGLSLVLDGSANVGTVLYPVHIIFAR
jgi:LEA14-like dessication related protein